MASEWEHIELPVLESEDPMCLMLKASKEQVVLEPVEDDEMIAQMIFQSQASGLEQSEKEQSEKEQSELMSVESRRKRLAQIELGVAERDAQRQQRQRASDAAAAGAAAGAVLPALASSAAASLPDAAPAPVTFVLSSGSADENLVGRLRSFVLRTRCCMGKA